MASASGAASGLGVISAVRLAGLFWFGGLSCCCTGRCGVNSISPIKARNIEVLAMRSPHLGERVLTTV